MQDLPRTFGQAVDARDQHALQGFWDRDFWHLWHGVPGLAFVARERAAFHQGANDLFDVKGIALGAIENARPQHVGQPVQAQQAGPASPAVLAANARHCDVLSATLYGLSPVPELVKAIDQVGNEGEEIIDHSFRQTVLLILIAMGAYIVARLIYNFLNQKLIRSQT